MPKRHAIEKPKNDCFKFSNWFSFGNSSYNFNYGDHSVIRLIKFKKEVITPHNEKEEEQEKEEKVLGWIHVNAFLVCLLQKICSFLFFNSKFLIWLTTSYFKQTYMLLRKVFRSPQLLEIKWKFFLAISMLMGVRQYHLIEISGQVTMNS